MIFGLSWKHPALILNGFAVILDVFYIVMMAAVLNVPADVHPYYRIILVGIGLSGLAFWCISEADTLVKIIIGYMITALNICFGCIFALISLSYLTGESSELWHLMHDCISNCS